MTTWKTETTPADHAGIHHTEDKSAHREQVLGAPAISLLAALPLTGLGRRMRMKEMTHDGHRTETPVMKVVSP